MKMGTLFDVCCLVVLYFFLSVRLYMPSHYNPQFDQNKTRNLIKINRNHGSGPSTHGIAEFLSLMYYLTKIKICFYL